MICETCKAEGKSSRVYDRGRSMTLLNCTPFYDEQGRQHYHDSNTTTSGYECSNGHSWVVKSKPSCWCGWPNEQKAVPAEPAAPTPAMTRDLLDEIKTKWNIPVTLPMSVPWGKDDVVWLVGEVERLRAEAKRADEEATKLANSDLATTEQIVRALRAENAALRAKVRTITDHYKPGWVDGLKAVARSAGFDPDDAPHDGVDPPTFIENVIDLLRADNARLRAAQAEEKKS